MDDRRLQQLYAAVLTRRAQWGRDDCLLFAGSVAEAITGRDPVAALRGTYHGKRAALAELGRWGETRLAAARARLAALGLVESPIAEALLGALGLVLHGGIEVMAARIEQGWIVRAERGIAVLAADCAVAAWIQP